jgi:ABC-type transport system substrate-binding protein
MLRIAVLGEATTTNVWVLFDEAGADYWNYVTQAAYWPRLYQLAFPSLESSAQAGLRFEPAAAEGEPAPIVCDAATCTATITLQPNLTWTDGSPLTAEDVAFTANTAVSFQLGLNWHQAYNSDVLDHVEALDERTIKFYFKGMPTVSDWQYGVLQGPILNQAYWQPRIVTAVELLPDETLLPTIRELEVQFADMQAQVDDLNLSLNTMAPASTVYQDTSKQAQKLQDELNSVYNKLEKARTEYETKLAEARAALFALANTGEPTLGPWQFESHIEGNFENQADLGTPFGDPWFDHVRYITYPNEAVAVSALLHDEVDVILTQAGLSPDSVDRLEVASEITLSRNATRSARFLAFNYANPYLADSALHQALACMINPLALAEELNGEVAPLAGFVLDDFWQSQDAVLPCAGAADHMRLVEAVGVLKAAGYSWDEEPGPNTAGKGLKAPDGSLLPKISLLSPTYAVDTQRAEAALYIARQASLLGVELDVRLGSADELLYDVYGSGNYDLVLLGWRLSAYPAYLCEWFVPSDGNPFAYNESRLNSTCEAWGQTSNLEAATAHASDVQAILMQDLPLIPLYTNMRVDAYRNIRYPFEDVVDGLSGLYAAPALAIPIP